MSRPALLLYCQHSLGLGHLKRSWVLAEAMVDRFGGDRLDLMLAACAAAREAPWSNR